VGFGLAVRVLLLLTTVVALSVLAVGGANLYQLRQDLESELEDWSTATRDALVDRGKAIGHSAALAAAQAVDSRDFLFLTELVRNTVGQDPEIEYGFLADKNGRVLVHSDPKRARETIRSDDYKAALADQKLMALEREVDAKPVIEVAAPVVVGGFVWGTLHFGMSLSKLHEALAAGRVNVDARVREGAVATVAATAALLAIALLVALLLSRRITAPLRRLLGDLEKIEGGDARHLVRVRGSQEFVRFGLGINELTHRTLETEKAVASSIQNLAQTLDDVNRQAKHKDEFLANVSHELRTPLNAILSVPRSLSLDYQKLDVWECGTCGSVFEPEDGASGEPQCPDCRVPMRLTNRLVFTGDAIEHAHFIGRVKNATEHMRRIVRSFIDYSQLADSEVQPSREAIDLRQVIDDVKATLSSLASEKQLDLAFPTLGSALVMQVDRTMFAQILINLIGNAVKFTPSGGRVAVEIEPLRRDRGTVVQLRVRDTGVGIPREQLEQIFVAFHQADNSHTRAFGGTGLGLSIARKLTELHGGRIWAESDGPGRGSVFTLEVPASAESAVVA
jgi:signal transduction histidine kinase